MLNLNFFYVSDQSVLTAHEQCNVIVSTLTSPVTHVDTVLPWPLKPPYEKQSSLISSVVKKHLLVHDILVLVENVRIGTTKHSKS